jgi:hypothetical protein
VAWVEEDTAVHAMVFDPAGKPRGPEFVVSPPGLHVGPVRAIGLANNSFAVCWFSGGVSSSGNLMLQVLTTGGEKAGDAKTLDLSRLGKNFALAPIVNASPVAEPGHFAVAHISAEFPGGVGGAGGGQRVVIGTVFGPTGERLKVASFNITHRERNTIASNLAMTVLPDKRFLVTWSERAIPDQNEHAMGEDVKAMLCHEERGVLPGSELDGLIPAIDVNTTLQGNQVLPSAAFAIDAETGESATAIVWLDDNTGSPDTALRAVKARVFAPTSLLPA